MVLVCDAFDAMTRDRPYGQATPPRDALAELRRCTGTQFDPSVVEALLAAWRERLGAAQVKTALDAQ